MTNRRNRMLVVLAALAIPWAQAAAQSKDPCIEKGSKVHMKCTEECWKPDATKKDQKPTSSEQACLNHCPDKAAKTAADCRAAEDPKNQVKKTKEVRDAEKAKGRGKARSLKAKDKDKDSESAAE